MNHMAREDEENLYRQCLADKLPNITQRDYVTCTSSLYHERINVLQSYIADVSEGLLRELHWMIQVFGITHLLFRD